MKDTDVRELVDILSITPVEDDGGYFGEVVPSISSYYSIWEDDLELIARVALKFSEEVLKRNIDTLSARIIYDLTFKNEDRYPLYSKPPEHYTKKDAELLTQCLDNCINTIKRDLDYAFKK